ncbi:Putative G-protein coupled receptor 111 [Heterocephalus glaber]|uniref:Putative G-protein coupled receptor 111 n=1 Tax=Heterocephalus glaber TaxID=10181 RepID=G5ASY9_HETGA|nr:Putative G-protein coupled receptor 111 [Heterocephalus glaber]
MICALLMCYLVFLVPTESCGKLCQILEHKLEQLSQPLEGALLVQKQEDPVCFPTCVCRLAFSTITPTLLMEEETEAQTDEALSQVAMLEVEPGGCSQGQPWSQQAMRQSTAQSHWKEEESKDNGVILVVVLAAQLVQTVVSSVTKMNCWEGIWTIDVDVNFDFDFSGRQQQQGEGVFQALGKQRWHKVTDTCCTLNAFNIFEEDSQSGNPFGGGGKVDEYARKSETIAGKLMQKCPADLSCAIRNIEQSPRLPGNIAFIVQLLHNISTALMADVEEAQMHDKSQEGKVIECKGNGHNFLLQKCEMELDPFLWFLMFEAEDRLCLWGPLLRKCAPVGYLLGALTGVIAILYQQSYSSMANHVLNSSSISNWTFIPERNSSCVLLHSVNSFARKLLINKSPINISNTFIHTMGSIIAADDEGKNFTFSMRVNDTSRAVTGKVLMGREELQTAPSIFQIISIAFPTLGAILEASLLENVTVNGLVLSVILPPKFKRISLLFEKISKSEERKTECVGWDHLESRWDSQACQMVEESSQHAVCQCWPSKLFTSFSILMSRHTPVSPVLTFITYIGLGISICSLLICLSIEALVWGQVTKTEISYLRHLCIANVAATLLMADVWFIVASFLSGPVTHHKGCVAATFFIHFFYLSVFFWMLSKALLILYGVLIVFHTLPKSILVASLFSVGYGCPLIIAIITVGVTEPGKGYLRPEACWLNWDMTRALLAFVVPALAIVVVNLVTIMLVIIKTQRVATGSSMFQEVRAVLRISKNIAILTPLLGLTWGFGIATVIDNSSLVFHIIFSLLNAFQVSSGALTKPKESIREEGLCFGIWVPGFSPVENGKAY